METTPAMRESNDSPAMERAGTRPEHRLYGPESWSLTLADASRVSSGAKLKLAWELEGRLGIEQSLGETPEDVAGR
jgi:hypothetical protein